MQCFSSILSTLSISLINIAGTLALFAQAGLPTSFWDDAFTTGVYLIDRMPTPLLQSCSPHEKLFKARPNYLDLRVFGCLCYPHTRPYNQNKLQYRSDAATFIGYSPSHNGYKALLPSGKVIGTRDVVFDESTLPFKTHKTPAPPIPYNFSSAPVILQPHNTPRITPQNPLNDPNKAPHNIPHNTSHNSPAAPHNSPHNSHVASSSSHSSTPAPLEQSSAATPLDTPPTSASSDSSSQSPDPLPQPTHHMTTRSESGIFKPKVFIASDANSHLIIPKSIAIVLSIPV